MNFAVNYYVLPSNYDKSNLDVEFLKSSRCRYEELVCKLVELEDDFIIFTLTNDEVVKIERILIRTIRLLKTRTLCGW